MKVGKREKRPKPRRPSISLSKVTATITDLLQPFGYVGGISFIGYHNRYLEGRIKCPGCGSFIMMDAERCPVCGRSIASDRELWRDPKKAMSPLNEVRSDIRYSLLGILIVASLLATAYRFVFWPSITISIALSMAFSLMRARKLA